MPPSTSDYNSRPSVRAFKVRITPVITQITTHALCEGHLAVAEFICGFVSITTHAPLRGASGLIMFGAPCSLITTPAPLQGASSNFSHDLWRHAITILAPLRGESGTSVLQHKELHYNSHPSVMGIYCRGGRIQLYYNSRPFTKDISIRVVV